MDTTAPAPATLALELRGLHKSFGDVHAVDGLDLDVRPGEVVAFLGPNGAGKTTTIDMVLGLSDPTAGDVRVFGSTPAEAIAAGRVAAVMQTGGLLKDITVAETVALTASLFGNRGPVLPFLERAGIAELAGRRVGRCSGGQQQRLRFAMALVSEPDLLLLDEPTTGMDVEGRRDFWAAIRADAAAGRTVVFATHYLDEADAYADRIVLVAGGRVVADGSAAEIKNVASGRVLSASFATPELAHDAARDLTSSGSPAEVRGTRLIVRTSASDDVARHLLTATSAHDLEVGASSLEDAFVRLTSSGRTDDRTDDPTSPTAPTGAHR
ncbi:ABC transporter ATP-binding protein [Cellulomonas sp. PhB143]|uniref:ABC transporter ATP-binding protein n=1 Tax=Cellulomonas sp. PhB143 TaxID=2485186 RepID=UPI000F47BA37|nr:ABC transporter ATP-binding protein [Cellulomonas sp. PhB143]ROS73682.1 ABC-2 type transport system ATP-binding protein [Cellulomonas sp. PhB143]